MRCQALVRAGKGWTSCGLSADQSPRVRPAPGAYSSDCSPPEAVFASGRQETSAPTRAAGAPRSGKIARVKEGLDRFVNAQNRGGTYKGALAELKEGRKRSHWMWFVFPQVSG